MAKINSIDATNTHYINITKKWWCFLCLPILYENSLHDTKTLYYTYDKLYTLPKWLFTNNG